jgi:hypothetical protein
VSAGDAGADGPVACRASVVVPAHNEADRIAGTLRALLASAEPGEFEVVVVCNGSTDATATCARSIAGVQVIEIPQTSKIEALREGDRRARAFPRIYLDADVRLSTATARGLAELLTKGDALVAGVPGRYDLDGAPLSVKLFLEFRQRMPVFAEGIIGAGVFALSERGRSRFGTWPDVLGDDQFVLRLFSPTERASLSGHHTIVRPPADLAAVISRGVRVRRGNAQLSAGGPELHGLVPPRAGLTEALSASAQSVRGVASIVVFGLVTVAIRVRARMGRSGDWAAS